MKIDLTKEDVQLLDTALEALNQRGQSRQGSQQIMALSIKLTQVTEVKEDDNNE